MCQFLISPTADRFLELHPKFMASFMRADEAEPGTVRIMQTSRELLRQFLKQPSVQKDPFLVDMIAYSVVPSYLNYFMLERSLTDFWELLGGLPTDVIYAFGRVIFVTPSFLHFIRTTVYELFQGLVNDRAGKVSDARAFLLSVYNSWRSHVGLVPEVVRGLLIRERNRSGGSIDKLLKDCFWDPFVKCPQRFLACRFNTWTDGLLGPLLGALDEFNNDYNFAELLRGAPPSALPITKEAEQLNPSAFDVCVLNDFDVTIDGCLNQSWSAETGTALWRAAGTYHLYEGRYSSRVPIDSFDRQVTATVTAQNVTRVTGADSTLSRHYLRQLLKRGPRLTPIAGVTAGMSDPVALISKFLVVEADSAMISRQNLLLAELTSAISESPFPEDTGDEAERERRLTEYFTKMCKEDTNSAERHVRELDLSNAVRRFGVQARQALECGSKILSWKFFQSAVLSKSFEDFEFKETYFRDPGNFRANLLQAMNVFGAGAAARVGVDRLDDLFYYITSRGLDFLSFRGHNQHLAALDAALNDLLRRWRLKNCPATRPPASGGRTEPSLQDQVYRHLDYFDCVGGRLCRAYEDNTDPITKLRQIGEAQVAVLEVAERRIGEVKPADRLLVLRLVYSYVNPEFLASAYAYILDFVGVEREDFERLDDVLSAGLAVAFDTLKGLAGTWFADGHLVLDQWVLSRHVQRPILLLFGSSAGKQDWDQIEDTYDFTSKLAEVRIDLVRRMMTPWTTEPGPKTATIVVPSEIGAFVLVVCPPPQKGGRSIKWDLDDYPPRTHRSMIGCAVWKARLTKESWFNKPYNAPMEFFRQVERASGYEKVVKILLYEINDAEEATINNEMQERMGEDVVCINYDQAEPDFRREIISALTAGLSHLTHKSSPH
jgi:hypothetical protein